MSLIKETLFILKSKSRKKMALMGITDAFQIGRVGCLASSGSDLLSIAFGAVTL